MNAEGGRRLITLTVKTTSGPYTDRFNSSNKARKVHDEAIEKLNLPSAGVTYTLLSQRDNRVLALDEKLEELDVRDGDVLVLQTNQAQDG